MNLIPPDKVGKLQEALHAKAKRAPKYRFYALYDKVYRLDVLWHAYQCCRANDGAPGVDGQTFADIEAYGVERWLRELAEDLRKKTYRPQAARRVYLPKPDGTQRPLGIPMIRAYCTPYQKPWGLGPCLSPGSSRVQASIRADGRCDDRFFQRRRTGFRSRSMTSGDSRTHHGPCAVARMPSSCPDSHQAAMVDTSTFSAFAAAWAEQRPSPRLPPGQAAGASGQPLAMSWT